MADNTLSCNPDTNQSCIRPIDGFGGSLYTLPFSIPTYGGPNTYANSSFANIDFHYQIVSRALIIQTVGLTLCLLTIANILVLTPPDKRKLLHNILLLGNIAQAVRCAINTSLFTTGYLSSSYLALTGDWSSSDWSSGFRGSLVVSNISFCISFACVQIAFCKLSHGILAWLRIKYSMYVYYAVFGIMVFLSLLSYSMRLVSAVNNIRFIAFQKQGDSAIDVADSVWYKTVEEGTEVLLGINLGMWSALFAISAAIIIWKRRKALFWLNEGTGSGKRNKVQSGYERALQVIGIVAVESFVIPSTLCVLDYLREGFWNLPKTDELIIPTILSLLPVLSLFNGGRVRAGSDASNTPGSDQVSATLGEFQN